MQSFCYRQTVSSRSMAAAMAISGVNFDIHSIEIDDPASIKITVGISRPSIGHRNSSPISGIRPRDTIHIGLGVDALQMLDIK